MMLRILLILTSLAAPPAAAETLAQQNARMFDQLDRVHNLSAREMARIKEIFAASGFAGQGNPAISVHPLTPEQCAARIPPGGPSSYDNAQNRRICGDRYMAPLYDPPATQRPEDAKACIDMFEFPNIPPCTYPVVWIKAREAAQVCAAQGKRLCDAHEWEGGACAGALTEPDYPFGAGSVAAMRNRHNSRYASTKTWAYGPTTNAASVRPTARKAPPAAMGGAVSGVVDRTPIQPVHFPAACPRWGGCMINMAMRRST